MAIQFPMPNRFQASIVLSASLQRRDFGLNIPGISPILFHSYRNSSFSTKCPLLVLDFEDSLTIRAGTLCLLVILHIVLIGKYDEDFMQSSGFPSLAQDLSPPQSATSLPHRGGSRGRVHGVRTPP